MEESGKLSPGVSKIREIKSLGNPFYLFRFRETSKNKKLLRTNYARIDSSLRAQSHTANNGKSFNGRITPPKAFRAGAFS